MACYFLVSMMKWQTLLKQIVKLYTTIRGFAFVLSCLEIYKQAQKKPLQNPLDSINNSSGNDALRMCVLVLTLDTPKLLLNHFF